MPRRRSYFKYKKNIITVNNSVWHHSGGALMKWFDENMAGHEYTIKFSYDEKGKIIHDESVQFVFDSPDASMLFKLLGNERWKKSI
jgi:hypothetical protein